MLTHKSISDAEIDLRRNLYQSNEMKNRIFVSLLLCLFALSLLGIAFIPAACVSNNRIAQTQNNRNTNSDSKPATDQNAGPQISTNESRDTKATDYFAHFKPEHRTALQAWLKTKPYLRPGVHEIDSVFFQEKTEIGLGGNMEFLRSTVGDNGYQYYAFGDMNHDGQQDFAVLLADTRKQKDKYDRFALAIFNEPLKSINVPAYFEEGLMGISNSYIVFDKIIEKYLYLGKLETDFYCATYYPKRKTYFFKDCLD